MENHPTEMFCASDVGSSLGGRSTEFCCLEARCADSVPGPPRVADALVVVVAGGREGVGAISVGRIQVVQTLNEIENLIGSLLQDARCAGYLPGPPRAVVRWCWYWYWGWCFRWCGSSC